MNGALGGLALLGLAGLLAFAWIRGYLNGAVAWVTGAFATPPTPRPVVFPAGMSGGGGSRPVVA